MAYDATGRLFSSTLNGTKTIFLYDGNELVAEYNSSGTLIRRYVHGIADDDPMVMYVGSGTTDKRYLMADERGSVIVETNSAGATTITHQYGPFGEPIDTSTSRFRYTGQILLPGTELYYYKARVYIPKLGRFLQTDPIGYKDGMNWYAYVGNDPMNGRDPSGRIAVNPVSGAMAGCAATGPACPIGAFVGGIGLYFTFEKMSDAFDQIEQMNEESSGEGSSDGSEAEKNRKENIEKVVIKGVVVTLF